MIERRTSLDHLDLPLQHTCNLALFGRQRISELLLLESQQCDHDASSSTSFNSRLYHLFIYDILVGCKSIKHHTPTYIHTSLYTISHQVITNAIDLHAIV